MGAARRKTRINPMLVKRILSSIVISVIGFFLIFSGGWIYTVGIAVFLAGAVWEFVSMFASGKYHPSPFLPALGTIIITIAANFANTTFFSFCYVLVIFTILIRSLIIYREFQETAALDLVIELASLVFVTYMGSYLIKIRSLPDGLFWIMISIFPACMGDISAYAFGTLFGKNQLSPNLSPKKTLEGYFSGIAAAFFTGYVLGLITNNFATEISITACMVIGVAVGVFSPLGDLSKSIFKRHFNLENTSKLIPGHGGILDRIDSWLWAAPIAYYLIIFFFL